jgi:hypothetical protein
MTNIEIIELFRSRDLIQKQLEDADIRNMAYQDLIRETLRTLDKTILLLASDNYSRKEVVDKLEMLYSSITSSV